MTKSDISKTFSQLRKFGYTVVNMNTKRALGSSGTKDFVDFCIFSKHYLVFIEVKIGKDFLSEGQKDTAIKLSSLMAINKSIHYYQIRNLNEAKQLQERLLSKTL